MVLVKSGSGPKSPMIFYAGVFDYNGLIETFANWCLEFGYEFHEDVFKHKVPSPAGSEQEFKFKAWKKITEYVQYWVEINGHIWELNEVEVKIGDKVKKMAKGKIKLVISCDTWLDYNNKFNTPITKKLQDFLHHHIWYKKITGGWTDESYYLMWKLHSEVKKFLKMSTPHNASDIRY